MNTIPRKVLVKITDQIATVKLNRPAVLNALDSDMALELKQVTNKLRSDSGVRCVVIQGAGEHFMAGGDLNMFLDPIQEYEKTGKCDFREVFSDIHEAISNLRNMDKPVIAKIHGAAAGFGLSLMLACDLVVATENAKFTLAYCNIGTSPDGGSTFSLPRHVGLKKAMEIALLGERFSTDDALAWGLVNRVVPEDELDSATQALADKLCAGPAAALARTKQLINQSLTSTLKEQLDTEAEAFQQSMMTPDFAEGVRAFLERRTAKFE